MTWTTTDLETIEAAIASGTLTCTFGDRSQTFRSVAELLKARDAIVSALRTGSRQFLGVARKGFGG